MIEIESREESKQKTRNDVWKGYLQYQFEHRARNKHLKKVRLGTKCLCCKPSQWKIKKHPLKVRDERKCKHDNLF